MTGRPFLDYYESLERIPTRQVLAPTAHQKLRRELYLRLGVCPPLIRGSSIVEFGPGSGENVAALSRLGPRKIVLVDGSSKALSASEARVLSAGYSGELISLHSDIASAEPGDDFDVAICEGVLPFQIQPEQLFNKVIDSACPDGWIVITTADSVSILSESLRRAAAHLAVQAGLAQPTSSSLSAFFDSDFGHLTGMSRNRSDWIEDQILQPWLGAPFSMPEALRFAGSRARLIGGSPSIAPDWRWFKDHSMPVSEINERAARWFEDMSHNLVDFRAELDLRPRDNSLLKQAADAVYAIAASADPDLDALHTHVDGLIERAGLPEVTRRSLHAFRTFMRTFAIADLYDFRPWWGRGQQYLSFCRE